MTSKRVALMQPYFFPYPRYFRLIADVDEFIIHDDIQFPKGGRVHRTEVAGPSGATEWLTLPLARAPFDTLICDRAFTSDARTDFDQRLARLGWVESSGGPAANRVREFLYAPLGSLVDYLEAGLQLVCNLFDIATPISRSSALGLGPLRRQERVIAAVKAAGGTHYINLPGGRGLYDGATFERNGIELSFLQPYDGPHAQLLPALMTLPPKDIPL